MDSRVVIVGAGVAVGGLGLLAVHHGSAVKGAAESFRGSVAAGDFAEQADQSEWRGEQFQTAFELNRKLSTSGTVEQVGGGLTAGLAAATVAVALLPRGRGTATAAMLLGMVTAIAGSVTLLAALASRARGGDKADALELLTTPTGSRDVSVDE